MTAKLNINMVISFDNKIIKYILNLDLWAF